VVFLGDAVHTAHFSVGSGTKMAMEDAVALASALAGHPGDVGAALTAYEEAAQPPVRRIQDSARPSLAWWERFGSYHDAFEPWQFAYHFLTRAMSDGRLARRAPAFIAASHRAWESAHGASPLGTPFSGGGWSAPGRAVGIIAGDGQPASAVSRDGQLPLLPGARPAPGPAWGALALAPDSEGGLPEAAGRLAVLAGRSSAGLTGAGRPVLAAVHGGTPLTRVLLCEEARLRLGLPALLIDPGLDRDQAATMVLSGRADLVGVPAEVAREWT
jgi:anthraniloyl-CoA monooxygenase